MPDGPRRFRAALLASIALLGACGGPLSTGDAGPDDAASDALDDAGAPDAFFELDAALPPAPEVWDPPFPISSAVGWHGSSEPVCSPLAGRVDHQQLAWNGTTLHLLAQISDGALGPGGTFPDGWALLENSGSGWSTSFTRVGSAGFGPLRASPDGGVFMGGVDGCPIARIEGDRASCAFSGDLRYGATLVDFVPRSDTTFWALAPQHVLDIADGAVDDAVPLTDVVATGLAASPDAWAVLADPATIVRPAPTARLTVPLEGGIVLAVSTGADGALWIGTSRGAVHTYREPEGWSAPIRLGDCGIRRIVVDGAGAYVATTQGVARIVAGEPDWLVDWCGSTEPVEIQDLILVDGLPVFAVDDERYRANECGATFLVHHDGTELRRF